MRMLHICFVFFLLCGHAFANAETFLTLEDAEKAFLEKNLSLLAAKFSVEAQQGTQIQAGLWNNPSFTYEQGLNHFYMVTPDPHFNTEFQIQQLFVIAKRDKKVQMATLDSQIASQSFYDALRSLKLELRRAFYNLHFLRKAHTLFDQNATLLQSTVAPKKGESLALETLLVTLASERVDILKKINEEQGNLRVLLGEPFGSTVEYAPLVDADRSLAKHVDFSLEFAIEKAQVSRHDLQSTELELAKEQINLSLQKLGWLPDFALGLRYSKSGNYVQDYFALFLSFDLPFFNRNQGETKKSKAVIELKTRQRDLARLQLENEVKAAYFNAEQSDKLFRQFGQRGAKSDDALLGDAVARYRKGKMSASAFAEFCETIRTRVLQTNQLQLKRLLAFEELVYAIGSD